MAPAVKLLVVAFSLLLLFPTMAMALCVVESGGQYHLFERAACAVCSDDDFTAWCAEQGGAMAPEEDPVCCCSKERSSFELPINRAFCTSLGIESFYNISATDSCVAACEASQPGRVHPCYNGILDQGEEGVDCGGPCKECAPVNESGDRGPPAEGGAGIVLLILGLVTMLGSGLFLFSLNRSRPASPQPSEEEAATPAAEESVEESSQPSAGRQAPLPPAWARAKEAQPLPRPPRRKRPRRIAFVEEERPPPKESREEFVTMDDLAAWEREQEERQRKKGRQAFSKLDELAGKK